MASYQLCESLFLLSSSCQGKHINDIIAAYVKYIVTLTSP